MRCLMSSKLVADFIEFSTNTRFNGDELEQLKRSLFSMPKLLWYFAVSIVAGIRKRSSSCGLKNNAKRLMKMEKWSKNCARH